MTESHLEMIPLLDLLPEGEDGYLAECGTLRRRAQAIFADLETAENVGSPLLREARFEKLISDCDALYHQIAGFHSPLPEVFQPTIKAWQAAIKLRLEETRGLQQNRFPSVFRAGAPVNPDEDAFVPRERMVTLLEQQLDGEQGCPALVLYSRRRMGKTSLLQNLPLLLANHLIPVYLSAQDAKVFSGPSHFIRTLHKQVGEIRPDFKMDLPQQPDLVYLSEMLETWQAKLGGHRLIICIDEYENLDRKMGQGIYDEDFLATVRESIQNHRAIIWVFAGSHRLRELQGPWTSYLVSAKALDLPAFDETETRLLLTDPMKHAPLFRHNENRPRFDHRFWGSDGVARVLAETAGWPHLVQLVASSAVAVVNERGLPGLDEAAWEACRHQAVSEGEPVFRELVLKECTSEAERAWLLGFVNTEIQAPPDDPKVADALKRRELVSIGDDGWRLRVPLMRYWLIHDSKT